MNARAIVLLSGGMDSVVSLYEAHRTHNVIATLSFDYQSKHNHREIPFARWHSDQLGVRHQIISLAFMGGLFASELLRSGGPIPDGHYEDMSMKKTVVPFRNGIMLSIAGGFAESVNAEVVTIGAHAGDHSIYPDCREEFIRAMGEALRLGTYAGVRIHFPFVSITKAEIVRLGQQRSVDFSRTWSCYKGGEVHCGACGACVERREAFMVAELFDPTEYLTISPIPPRARA